MIFKKFADDEIVNLKSCVTCGYTHKDGDDNTDFMMLETMQCFNQLNMKSTRLYACPKCGTISIIIDESNKQGD